MRPLVAISAACLFACASLSAQAKPAGSRIVGHVTFAGHAPKRKAIDLAKEPVCSKLHAAQRLYPEALLVGPGNSLRNVVVYVSAGAPPSDPVPAEPAVFDQIDCSFTTHVLIFRVGQEVKISNSDPLAHNVHPVAKVNREWNKMEPPGTPPFSYAYDSPEFIPVHCNLHPWMLAYFVVLNTSFYAITGEDGRFSLPDLPPGQYTLTAWHEELGTQSREITVTDRAESLAVNFTFFGKP